MGIDAVQAAPPADTLTVVDTEMIVILTALGTLLTALFTGYFILQTWLHSPRPMWGKPAFDSGATPDSDRDAVLVSLRMTNFGTGPAFKVRIASGETAAIFPRVESGAEIWLQFTQPIPGLHAYEDAHGNMLEYTGPIDWGERRLTLIWTQPPHLWLTKRKAWRLRNVPGLREQ